MIIKPTAEDCVRVTIGNWEVWIDDSTGEKIIDKIHGVYSKNYTGE